MGMKVNAELPLPADLKAEYPLSDKIIALKKKGTRKSAMFLSENQINFLSWLAPVQRTMKMRYAST